jgi:tetratricopeptide (TPR) repeat protein
LPKGHKLSSIYVRRETIKAGYLVMESKHRSEERARATGPLGRVALAFCTGTLVLALLSVGTASGGFAAPENLAFHTEQQIQAGAVSLPLDAELEYDAALTAIRKGDLAAAKEHLESSIALAPLFTDSYFTLARIEARRLSPDAVYWLSQGVVVTARSFEAQSLFAANAGITLMLVFLIASGIVWIALAIRYFPFVAHRFGEWFANKFNAAMPRACAYLLMLVPFVVFPRYAWAVALVLLATWPFLQRRERVLSLVSAGGLAALLWFAPTIDRYSPIADPSSLTSLIAQANESAADPTLAALIAATPARGLDAEQQNALGLLAMRDGDQDAAVGHFLRAIEFNPDESISYVNLGNVYYLNGHYNKALEGYRKAEQVNAGDAVGQYNLAQAYIKTLLMGESSQALERASQAGFEPIRDSFAERARKNWQVFPRIYCYEDFWRMAATEGKHENAGVMSSAIASATGLPVRVSFIIIVAAMIMCLVVGRLVKGNQVAFQCSNCGELTCNGCCDGDRGAIMCQACSKAVGGVSSDKVLDALLRQRRQSVIVKRRKSIKWVTVWLPGVRHLFYGRLVSGVVVASLFAGSVVALCSRGYLIPRWSALDYSTPLWVWVVPLLGIALSYLIAVTSRQLYEMRTTRIVTTRSRAADVSDTDTASA